LPGSCESEGPYKISMVEHAFQPVVVSDNSIFYGPAGSQDQTGDFDKCLDKALKFHANDGKTQGTVWHQHSIPGFQIPGQRGDNHIGPVGI